MGILLALQVAWPRTFRGGQNDKSPDTFPYRGSCCCKSLTMTYFHRRMPTIIGAEAFHGPVRDGKGWDHLAMVVKRNLSIS